jgi:hypothetical protein
MLHGVKPRAFGKHPTRENPLLAALELHLVHLDERGGVRRLRGRAAVADTRRHLQRAELDRLADGDLEMRDASRHLVEGGKHGNRVLDDLGLSETSRQRQGRRDDSRGKRAPCPHSAVR